jgi:hypothetical protein
VFPLAAIMTAKLMTDLAAGAYKVFYKIIRPFQYFIGVALLAAAFLTFSYVFKTEQFWFWVCLWVVLILIALAIVLNKKTQVKYIWASVLSIMIANVFMSTHFYPQLLKYQLGSEVGHYIKQHLKQEKIVYYKPEDALNSLSFYADRLINKTKHPQLNTVVLTMQKGLDTLKMQNIQFTILKQGGYFSVSQLTPAFLNPETRAQTLQQYYLLKLHE